MRITILILLVLESFWYVKIPSDFAENMKGRVGNDNIFTYGISINGDTVTSANTQRDFPTYFDSLKKSGFVVDSLRLSPDDFQQEQMK